MLSLRSLKSVSEKHNIIFASITWLCRILVGITFIFSGFVKAIDVWGTIYKLGEYLSAIGIELLPSLVVAGVFALCIFEFLIGICLLLGCYRRSMPRVATLFMLIMVIITLWIAVADPVSDCGCFGDFLVISNWATLGKNVVLIVLCLWLVIFNVKCTSIISPAFQWVAFVATVIAIGFIEFYGYAFQPLVDFRGYPVGGNLIEFTSGNEADINIEEDSSEDSEYIFIYEKDGVKKEFGIEDDLPEEEDGWKFIERKEIFNAKPVNAKSEEPDLANSAQREERNLRIWNKNGTEDVSEDVVTKDGAEIIVMMPDLKNVSPAITWKINALYDWAQKHNVEMIAVASASPKEISDWEDISMPQYSIYTADDTAIKEAVRGNPGLIYLENGKIVWKSTLNALDTDAYSGENVVESLRNCNVDSRSILKQIAIVYLLIIAILVIVSYVPRIYGLLTDIGRRITRKESGNNKDSAK